jgi:hypothetical protein
VANNKWFYVRVIFYAYPMPGDEGRVATDVAIVGPFRTEERANREKYDITVKLKACLPLALEDFEKDGPSIVVEAFDTADEVVKYVLNN